MTLENNLSGINYLAEVSPSAIGNADLNNLSLMFNNPQIAINQQCTETQGLQLLPNNSFVSQSQKISTQNLVTSVSSAMCNVQNYPSVLTCVQSCNKFEEEVNCMKGTTVNGEPEVQTSQQNFLSGVPIKNVALNTNPVLQVMTSTTDSPVYVISFPPNVTWYPGTR